LALEKFGAIVVDERIVEDSNFHYNISTFGYIRFSTVSELCINKIN